MASFRDRVAMLSMFESGEADSPGTSEASAGFGDAEANRLPKGPIRRRAQASSTEAR